MDYFVSKRGCSPKPLNIAAIARPDNWVSVAVANPSNSRQSVTLMQDEILYVLK